MMSDMQKMLGTAKNAYAWWLRELSGLLTARASSTRPWRLLIRRAEAGLEIIENRNGTLVSLASGLTTTAAPPPQLSAAIQAAARGSGSVILRLSPEEVVERTIQIPKAASDVIAPVVRNHMNRIVPWPREETHYGFEVAGANPHAPDQMDIRVVATTQSILDEALAGARALGASPSVIDFAPGAAAESGIALLSLEPDPRKRVGRQLHRALMTLLVAALAIGCFGIAHCWQAARESRDLGGQIAAARMNITQMSRQDAGNARLRQATGQLIERRANEPAMVVLINALSRALPSSAYLTELDIRGRQARILGKSHDAAALIAEIEGAPEYEAVLFAASTTREAGERLESFAITARATQPRARQEDTGDAK